MTVEDWLGNDELPLNIWKNKYQYNDETLDEWFNRVSGGNKEVKQLIKDKKFLFGGRILANRGLQYKGKKITLSNCYVIKSPKDNLESIFETGAKLAHMVVVVVLIFLIYVLMVLKLIMLQILLLVQLVLWIFIHTLLG